MSNPSLDKILERVRTLITTAEKMQQDADRPGLSDSERSAFLHDAEARRTMADSLMLKYQIEEITAEQAPGSVQSKPMILTVQIGPSTEVTGYINWMMQRIAEHCRCKVRSYTSWTDGGWNAKIYGFESDVRYFELLYTTVRLHMLGALLPRVDASESLEDNAYRLHNSGYNWLQIAEMYGWQKDLGSFYHGEYNGTRPPAGMKVPYWHKEHGWQPATQVGSRIKRAYHRACAERNEPVQKIAANGTATYRKSAADGYVGMISRRLTKMASERDTGAALLLRSRIDDLDALFRQDNPDLFPTPEQQAAAAEAAKKMPKGRARKVVYKPTPINADAYARGAAHAAKADLHGSSRMGNGGQNALN